MDDTYVSDPAHDIGIRPHADRTHPPVLNPTAADLMNRSVVAAHANDPVDMAWNLMRGLDVHHFPVVDGGRYIGLVDDTAIACAWLEQAGVGGTRRTLRSLSRALPMTNPGTLATELAHAMCRHGVDAMLVVDDDQVVGIVTIRDIVRVLALWPPAVRPPQTWTSSSRRPPPSHRSSPPWTAPRPPPPGSPPRTSR
jgi:CBS domain-containing protein